MTSEALRVDLAKLRTKLQYLGAFADGGPRPSSVDGVPVQLVRDYESLNDEFDRRGSEAA
jgi:hypothetical protein